MLNYLAQMKDRYEQSQSTAEKVAVRLMLAALAVAAPVAVYSVVSRGDLGADLQSLRKAFTPRIDPAPLTIEPTKTIPAPSTDVNAAQSLLDQILGSDNPASDRRFLANGEQPRKSFGEAVDNKLVNLFPESWDK